MHGYKTGGLRDKYIVVKTDGTKTDEGAYYFPLRLDADPHARYAAMCYAQHIFEENRQLAEELAKKVHDYDRYA